MIAVIKRTERIRFGRTQPIDESASAEGLDQGEDGDGRIENDEKIKKSTESVETVEKIDGDQRENEQCAEHRGRFSRGVDIQGKAESLTLLIIPGDALDDADGEYPRQRPQN